MRTERSEASLAEVVDRLASKGVRLRSENGQLKYRAIKGAVSQEDIDALSACKDQMVALVEGAQADELGLDTALQPGAVVHLAPLAFSQLAHWDTYRLAHERSCCVVGFPTRWRGHLNVSVLQRALREMVRRHDALRTRIVIWQGTPLQEIRDRYDCELIVEDLSWLEEDRRDAELLRRVSRCMFEPIDVTVFPLYRFRLIRIREDDHVLVTAMEHIITDGYSLNLFQKELFCVYQDIAHGRPLSLLPVSMQFSDYVIWQRGVIQSWKEQHRQYWAERLNGCQRLKFPRDGNEGSVRRLGFGLIPIRFRSGLKEELGEWCRRHGTTLVISVFTAYVALVLRWCNVQEAVILFQSSGRTSSIFDRTFGYLASPLYLRLALFESDSFIDLLQRVTEEYCNANEHADFSFLEAQQPRPDFALNTLFNWLPQAPPVDESARSANPEHAMDVSWFPFEPPVVTHYKSDIEPATGFMDTDEGIVGYVQFPLNRFSAALMQRFAHSLELLIEMLLREPGTKVQSIVFK